MPLAFKTYFQTKTIDVPLPRVAHEPRLEDLHRPTHFQGVCNVVARLFDMVKPIKAFFGEKDYQQLLVIREMVEQLNRWEQLEIIGVPTKREENGLAMSSRNVNLSDAQRSIASALHQAITCRSETEMLQALQHDEIHIEYAVLRDAVTLGMPCEQLPKRSLVAATIGSVRLIDNGAVL